MDLNDIQAETSVIEYLIEQCSEKDNPLYLSMLDGHYRGLLAGLRDTTVPDISKPAYEKLMNICQRGLEEITTKIEQLQKKDRPHLKLHNPGGTFL